MEYTNTERIESKLFPGVAFVFYKMIEERRIELRRLAADLSSKLRKLATQTRKLEYEFAKTDLSDDQKEDLMEQQDLAMNETQSVLITELYPLYIKWGIQSVEGLTVNGEACTAPEGLKWGPEKLYHEALGLVQERMGLTEKQIKNLSSLTTSTEPEGGETSDTIAPIAETQPTDSIASATAASSSPTT